MKRILSAAAFFVAIAATAFGQNKNFIDQPYVEVSGSADTLVTPNQIYIQIIISEKDSKDKLSVEEQESKMIDAFQSLHINTEKDLTTRDMLSNYKSYFLRAKEILKTKEYVLKVSNAATASQVFVELEALGISNVSIDKVDRSDTEHLKNICRIKAIENARQKAVSLTKALGQSVGNAIHISDNEARFDDMAEGRIVVMGYAAKKRENYEAPKIEFEKVKVSAAVSAKFILK